MPATPKTLGSRFALALADWIADLGEVVFNWMATLGDVSAPWTTRFACTPSR